MNFRSIFLSLALLGTFQLSAQVDPPEDDDDFDFSDFEPASPPAKSYANNKVLGQSPTTLVGIFYDFHAPHDLTSGNLVAAPETAIADDVRINPAQAVMATANIPLISKSTGLLNLNVFFQRQLYNIEGSNGHPLSRSLNENGLTRSSIQLTYFKPLDEKRFFLFQGGLEMNGDYGLEFQPASTLRVPAAVLYGWKKNDRLIYAFGLSRTYLGGSLNYVPIVYYFHTFRNQNWGIEAVAPARGALRYRFNSLTLLSFGWNTLGATYRLNNFGEFASDFVNENPGNRPTELLAREAELRRSEVRVGFTFQRQITGFFWLNVEAGYRVNYSFGLDEDGDFLRFFGNDLPYFIENDLRNTPYFTLGISYMSP